MRVCRVTTTITFHPHRLCESFFLNLVVPMANVLTVQGLQNISPRPRDDFLALGKIKNSPLDVWQNLSKFTHEERNRLLTAVVVS